MRPSLSRSKAPLLQYCANCRTITGFSPISLSRHIPTQARQSLRSFQSSAQNLYARGLQARRPLNHVHKQALQQPPQQPPNQPTKLKAKSPIVDDAQLPQWEQKYPFIISL